MKTLKTIKLVVKALTLVAVREFNLFTCVHPVLRQEAMDRFHAGACEIRNELRKL